VNAALQAVDKIYNDTLSAGFHNRREIVNECPQFEKELYFFCIATNT
jgi:hypothetical protein